MKFKLLLFFTLIFTQSSFAGEGFNRTCSDVYVALSTGAPILTADCIRIDNTYNHATLILEGLVNINGNLVYQAGRPSTFQKSCGTIYVGKDQLRAVCRMESGGFSESGIYLPISNTDGQLTY